MSYTVFSNHRIAAKGSLAEVTAKVRDLDAAGTSALVFDDETGRTIDVDLRASPPADEKKPGPGRPKLGVVCREVSLLPRHWEWLSTQPGGASVTLRKLVEEARRSSQGQDQVRRAQEAAYWFMHAIAGNLAGYEEALRALYARNASAFNDHMQGWPDDVRAHALALAQPSF